ncbi:MAG: flagellar export protein FliJ [Oscillospiraceae bacterium]|jgi:flagellar FliJ protein|nr:flagellar export protein FliJ [Oscillospiraceae bacterium]
MKKFSFSLQRLMGYKEQILDVEITVLADMNAALNGFLAELSELESQHEQRGALLREKARAGISAVELETHKNYLTSLDFSIKQKKQQIKMQRMAIDKQMDKVREAKVEISTMEKLREKKLEEYNYAARKAEELMIEEFVSFSRTAEASV